MEVKRGACIIGAMLTLSFASLLYNSLTVPNLIVSFVLETILFIVYFGNKIELDFFVCFIVTSTSLMITNVNHSALGSTFIVLNVFMLCYLFNNIKIWGGYCRILRVVLCLFLFLYCASCNNALLLSYKRTTDALGNIVNGNHLGYLTLIMFFTVSTLLFETKFTKTKALIYAIIAVASISYINLTGCRTAILSMVLFFALLILKRKPFADGVFKTVVRVELVLCFLFPLAYIYLSSKLVNADFIGKTIFSGREILWQSGLKLIQQYPLFGSGNDFMYSLGKDTIASSHNFILGVVKMFGILPALSLIYMFPQTTMSSEERIRQFVIISVLLVGFTEASFIESHSSLFFMMLFLQSAHEKELKMNVPRYVKN